MNIQSVPLHVLVEQTRQVLEKRSPDQYSRVGTQRESCFEVTVGKDSIPRALQILESLAKRVEALGWEIKPKQGDHSYEDGFAAIYIEGHAVALSVFESATIDFDAPTDEWDKQTFTLSGQLQLKLGRYHAGPGKKIWIDTKNLLLETQLDSFIDAVRMAASHIKREWEENQKVLAAKFEKERILKVQTAKISHLNSVLETWEKCNRIRDLLKAVAAQMDSGGVVSERLAAMKEWYQWASSYIASIDPVNNLMDKAEI